MTDGKTAMVGGTVDILKASDFAMIAGDSIKVLLGLPAGSVNCVVTSPPYWGQREYDGTGIGMESGFDLYRERLAAVFSEVYRVLADDGSLWLNMGDTTIRISWECRGGWRLISRMPDGYCATT